MSSARHTIDLKSRKLSIIEWVARVQDEALIAKIEELQRKARVKRYESKLKPLSAKQMQERARYANEDIKAGRYITTEELEKESENW